MILCTRRRPRSAWSGVNKDKIARLTAEGRMHPAGLSVVERAKHSGAWTLLDSASKLEVPADLDAAFDEKGRAYFEAFPASVRRAILEWITQAKTHETRANE
jgi:uncharacterized protein YdeI (YjbR/CyaY-like superfamily)